MWILYEALATIIRGYQNLSDRLNPSEGKAERLTLADTQFICVFLPLRVAAPTELSCSKGDTIFLIHVI